VTHVLLTGGARSGKSALAIALAGRSGADVFFLATGQPGDDEMAARIARHRAERPPDWTTIEEPLRLLEAIGSVDPRACLIVDCLSLWVANLLATSGQVDRAAAAAADAAAARPGTTIVVTNEVGLGVVPATPLGREYRDVLGRVNAIWAERASAAYLVVAGRLLPLLPASEVLDP
jgi:adenosylcobinamide kinase / adenosylcobinamide-phosphate guanylyltransferase